MKIKEITEFSNELTSIIDDLLELLTSSKISMDEQLLKEIIASENSHLFFALNENEKCMGMLTVGIYASPTGKKAWIEDVVVDENYRGQGIGKELTNFAIDFAKQKDVSLLSLTSRPSRVSANKLYAKLGFERKETNAYVMKLN